MVGKRTGNLYVFEKLGDEEAIQYNDLKAEMNAPKSKAVYNPNIIILNKDVYANNSRLKELYASLYDPYEIQKMLCGTNETEIKLLIESSDENRLRSIKTMIADLIAEGRLYNIRVVSMIDEMLDTEYRKAFIS